MSNPLIKKTHPTMTTGSLGISLCRLKPFCRWVQRLPRKLRSSRSDVFMHPGPYDPPASNPCTFHRYAHFEQVPASVRQALLELRGERALRSDEQEMRDGAVMWVGMIGDELVGVRFTRRGGRFRHWFIPLADEDLVVFRGYTAPAYRGKGISPAMMRHILSTELRDGGRAYSDCSVHNKSSRRSLTKAGFVRVARCKPLTREQALGAPGPRAAVASAHQEPPK